MNIGFIRAFNKVLYIFYIYRLKANIRQPIKAQ